MDSFPEERIPCVLPTILCRWYRLPWIWRYYHYILDFYHRHSKNTLVSPIRFYCFSGQLFFIMTWISESCGQFDFSPIRHFARIWLLHFALWCQKSWPSWLFIFIRHVLRTLVICFDSAFDTFCTATAAHTPWFAIFSQRVHIGINRSPILTSSTTKRSALLIAFDFVPVFLFCTMPYGCIAWVRERIYIRCQGSGGRGIDLG